MSDVWDELELCVETSGSRKVTSMQKAVVYGRELEARLKDAEAILRRIPMRGGGEPWVQAAEYFAKLEAMEGK